MTTQAGVARLLTIGVGGGGANALNRMIEAQIHGVEFVAMNTDAQALQLSQAPTRIQLGETLTRGLGAGGNPEIGRQAAEESYAAINELLAGADMVFITAGMGGGTGTGAAPLIAQAAREQGALVVAIVTTPFAFERRRKIAAEQGIAALREVVDALIIVPNERLMQLAARDMSAFEAYRLADDVLRQGIQGISDLITIPGLINLDFADIRVVMADAGSALMSVGQASGENRAEQAAQSAITNPLLEVDISGARGVVFNITGSDDLTMYEVNRIADIISGAAHPDANIIFGTVFDKSLAGSLKITLVATAFEPRVSYDRQRRGLPRVGVTPSPAPSPSPSSRSASVGARYVPPAGVGSEAPRSASIRAGSSAPDIAAPAPYLRVDTPTPPSPARESFTITPRNDQNDQSDAHAYAAWNGQNSQNVPEPIPLSRDRMRERTPVIRDLPRPLHDQDDLDDSDAPSAPSDFDTSNGSDKATTSQDGNNHGAAHVSQRPAPRAERQQRPDRSLPGYHGDEFLANDEPEEEQLAPAPRRPWDRIFDHLH